MTGNGTHTTYTDGIFEGWSIIVLATLHKVGMALGIDAFLPGRWSFSLRWTTKAEPKKRHAGQLIHLKSARLYSCRLLLWSYSLWILTVRNALKIALNPDTMAGMIRWRNDNTGNNGSHLVAILSDGSDQRCAFCSDIPVPLRGLDRSLQQEPDLKFADKMGWNQSIVDRCNHSCRRDWWNQFIANLNGWKCRMKPWFLAREPSFRSNASFIQSESRICSFNISLPLTLTWSCWKWWFNCSFVSFSHQNLTWQCLKNTLKESYLLKLWRFLVYRGNLQLANESPEPNLTDSIWLHEMLWAATVLVATGRLDNRTLGQCLNGHALFQSSKASINSTSSLVVGL